MAELAIYNEKRNFEKTREPKGKQTKAGKRLRYVIQHHLARRGHYDLRLEWDGRTKINCVRRAIRGFGRISLQKM